MPGVFEGGFPADFLCEKFTPVQTNSTFKVTASKIELRLRKSTIGQRWEQLEETEAAPVIQHNRTKNWDQIGKEAEEEHKKDVEEGGGEAALQQMFKVIPL